MTNKMTKKVYVFLAILILVTTVILLRQKNRGKFLQEGNFQKFEVKGKLVEGFPQFPLLPEAEIKESYRKESGEKVGYEAEFKTSKSPKGVLLWYMDELEKTGWSVYEDNLEESERGDYYLLVQKNDQKVNVFAENEEEATEVSIEFPLQ